jgi:hypothetical protein
MRLTHARIFKAGMIHGRLLTEQGLWEKKLGALARQTIARDVWERFSKQLPKEAEEYRETI